MNSTNGILGSVRAPLNSLISALPGDRLLSTAQSQLGGTFSNLPFIGDSALTSLPVVNRLNLANFQENLQEGTLLDGTLLDGELLKLPAEFIKIREAFIDAFSRATKLPADAIRQFLTISESIAAPGMPRLLPGVFGVLDGEAGIMAGIMDWKSQFLQTKRDILSDMMNRGETPSLNPESSDIATQKKIVELYSTLDPTELGIFRGTLGQLRKLLPGSSNSEFMGLPNLGLLEDVRKNVLNGVFADGPLANLRESATSYVEGVFPIIGQFADVDSVLDSTSLELGRSFGMERYPIDSLARLIDLKMNILAEVVEFNTELVMSVADITKELVSMAIDVVPIIKEMMLLIPELTIDVMLELITVVFDVANGVIDMKLAVLEWVIKLPIELINVIIDIKVDIFADLEFVKLGILENIWTEAQSALNMYTDFSGFLDVSPEIFPLDLFGNLSRDLILRNSFSQ